MKAIRGRIPPARLLTAADLAATFLFAVQGAAVAAAADLDLFGVLVIAFVSSTVGGIVRDLLIGDVPPFALRSLDYTLLALLAGGTVFLFDAVVTALPGTVIMVLDAAGLGLFAVVGAVKARDHGLRSGVCVLLGTIAATGGGVARDLLLSRVPGILRTDIYAVAAAAGALTTVLCLRGGMGRTPAMVLGALVCFTLRVVSVSLHWNLPRL